MKIGNKMSNDGTYLVGGGGNAAISCVQKEPYST